MVPYEVVGLGSALVKERYDEAEGSLGGVERGVDDPFQPGDSRKAMSGLVCLNAVPVVQDIETSGLKGL